MSRSGAASPDASAAGLALPAAAGCVVASLAPVFLFQTLRTGKMADPPLRIFDSEQIVTSQAAHPFGIPDSILGLANFGVTFALTLGGRRSLLGGKLLGGKLLLDGAAATFNLARQVTGFRKLCFWCTLTAGLAITTVWLGRGYIARSLGGNWSPPSGDHLPACS
jgi:uncharacterized membrane protein